MIKYENKKVNLFDNVKSTIPIASVSITEIHHKIKSENEIKTLTQTISNEIKSSGNTDSATVKKLKEKLPAVTFAGTFKMRNNDSIISYAGLMVIDIDHIESVEKVQALKTELSQQEDVLLIFVSPRGLGLKIVHKIQVDQSIDVATFHKATFAEISKHYEDVYSIEIDKSGKDLARLCFLAHDSEVYLNESAIDRKIKIEKNDNNLNEDKTEHTQIPFRNKIDASDIIIVLDDILDYLQKNKMSITKSYHQWIRVGFCLKKELGEEKGLEYFDQFSRLDKSYDSNLVRTQFDKGNKNHPKSPTLGTIIHYALQQNYKLLKLSQVKRTALNDELARAMLKDAEIEIRMNTIKGVIEYKKRNGFWHNVNDRDLCYLYIDVLKNIFNKNYFADWLFAKASKWKPEQEFLKSLPSIDDNIDYIGQLVKTITTSDPKISNMLVRKWLIGVIASLKNEKSYNENILVLQGDQGIGKTRWVRKLIPDEWQEYLLVRNIDPNNKDHLISLSENFIIYMDELDGIVNRKASIESFKALTSLDKVSVRKPYDRFNTESPRLASFIGSLNDLEFLKDPTGNRRFFVIKAEKIDHMHSIDMMKVFKQALIAYENGATYYLNNLETNLLNEHNKQFEATNLFEELVGKYFEVGEKEEMSAIEIIQFINQRENFTGELSSNILDPRMSSYMGKILTKLGFIQKRFKSKGKSRRVYSVRILPNGNGFTMDKDVDGTYHTKTHKVSGAETFELKFPKSNIHSNNV